MPETDTRIMLVDDHAIVAQSLSKVTGEDDPLVTLSAREFEIFRLIARGQTVSAIASLLSLSGKTVAPRR